MSRINTYKILFSTVIYHEYHLNNGRDLFKSLSPEFQSKQLKSYRSSNFITTKLSKKSSSEFKGRKLKLIANNSGFNILAQVEETVPNSNIYNPKRPLDQDYTIDILLYVNDPQFEIYSTISAIKTIPFYFSNKEPNAHVGTFNYIDTNNESDIDDFTIQQVDYDEISTRLTAKEMHQLFGIISIEMKGDNAASKNVLETNGNLVGNTPQFKIYLENRNTIWNYMDKQTGVFMHSSDPELLPLVKNGLVKHEHPANTEMPSAIPNRLIYEKDGNGNIIKTISEIYI